MKPSRGRNRTTSTQITFLPVLSFDPTVETIAHMSSASLGDKNPGVETLTLSYSVPFGKLFGN